MRDTRSLSSKMKATALLLVIFVGLNCLAHSSAAQQTSVSGPAFEAASVRLSDPNSVGALGPRIQTSPGLLTARGVILGACITLAYQMQPNQIIGPDWLGNVRLDIVAKAATPVGDQELYLMLRTLLAERMGVRTHVERRSFRNRPLRALGLRHKKKACRPYSTFR